MPIEVKPWGGMNVKSHWSGIEVQDKVVLDIGADYGTTADFFLRYGAKQVVAVESDDSYAQQLVVLASERPGLIALHRHVTTADDFRALFEAWKPDVVKLDCEGCECALLELDDDWFARPAVYVMETHGPEQAERDGNPFPLSSAEALHQFLLLKFQRCGYEVVRDIPHCCGHILYARKRSG